MFNRLITYERLNNAIEQSEIKLPDNPTEEDKIDYIKRIIVEAINSIDERELYSVVSEQLTRELRRQGVRF